MWLGKPIWLTPFVLGAAFGCALGGCAWVVTGAWEAAACSAIAGIGPGLVVGWLLARQERIAEAALRRPELRSEGLGGTGAFAGLLGEMLRELGALESRCATAGQRTQDLEARSSVRQKELSRFESALDCLPQPVLITNENDDVVFANASAVQRFVPSSERASRAVDLTALPDVARLVAETRARCTLNDPRKVEFEFATGEDAQSYRATSRCVRIGGSGSPAVVTLFDDIRDDRRERTRHAEFVSSASHELKTPLAGIKAFTEMLIDGDVSDPAEQQEMFGFIDQQVDRLTRMINNMLNLARIESGVIPVHRADAELNELLSKALDVVRPTAEEKGIDLIPELSELYLPVHVDRDLFGQAIINLLSNAVKYTPKGGEVRLRCRMDEAVAIVEVRDTGMGIPADSLPRIFERFYRVPENNKAAAGTGLGLALVQYITTELHPCALSVESVVNQGSCFRLTVPLGHVDGGRRLPEAAVAGV